MSSKTVLTRYEVASENLPAEFDGFHILQVSDFHCVPKKDMLGCLEGEKADVIFATGDMTDEDRSYAPYPELMAELLKLAPVYLVSGNHDSVACGYEEFYLKTDRMGVRVLCNETAEIERNGAKLYIHGIEDPISEKRKVIDERVKCSLEKLDREDGFEILLFHRANKLDLFKDADFDLIFSGHMHGGQIRLPHLGGVLSPKSGIFDSGRLFFPKYSGGIYKVGKATAIVNCGMGNSVPLPRWGNPTEIVSVRLKKK